MIMMANGGRWGRRSSKWTHFVSASNIKHAFLCLCLCVLHYVKQNFKTWESTAIVGCRPHHKYANRTNNREDSSHVGRCRHVDTKTDQDRWDQSNVPVLCYSFRSFLLLCVFARLWVCKLQPIHPLLVGDLWACQPESDRSKVMKENTMDSTSSKDGTQNMWTGRSIGVMLSVGRQ